MNECFEFSSPPVQTGESDLAYGCVFCLSGKELDVAKCMEEFCQSVRAKPIQISKRFTNKGVTTILNEVVLNGYVFFQAPAQTRAIEMLQQFRGIYVLTYSDGDWRLFGEDKSYAKWIFKYDGILQLSRAHQIGDRISIIDGPLKDLEGQITKIDRRNKSGQVTVNFAGKEHKIWLGFDLVKASVPSVAYDCKEEPFCEIAQNK